MRRLTIALMLVLTLAAAALAQGADAQAKAEQILKQARAAIGDEGKLKTLQGFSAAGTVRRNMRGPDGTERSIESELEIEALLPDKIKKTENTQRGTAISALNGAQTWNDFVAAAGGGGGFGGGPGGGGPGGGAVMVSGGPGGPGGANSPMGNFRQQQQRRELVQIMLGLLLTAPASAQMQYSYIGEAPGPEGTKLDVIDGKGADNLTVRLYFDKESHQLIGLSYKAKSFQRAFAGRGPGGQGGGRGQGGQGGQGGQPAAPGGQPGAAGGQGAGQEQRPQPSPEERERRMKEMMEAFEKSPDVDYRWAFTDYKGFSGINLPTRITKLEGGTPNEEWTLNKVKINPKLTPDKFEKKEKEKS